MIRHSSFVRLLLVFLVACGLATAAWAQFGPTAPPAAGLPTTDRVLYGTTYQERLALLWVSNFEGETVIQGKMFQPMAMHRVTVSVSGKKAPGGSKKDAKMMETGSSAGERGFEKLLVASYPLTVRSTFRVPERLPKQGKTAFVQELPPPGQSVRVLCTISGEEMTKCLAVEESFSPVGRDTCERLAAESDRIDAASCESLPEQSPIADLLAPAEPG